MNKFLIVAFFFFNSSAFAGLNDSGQKKVTVGSEILRGKKATLFIIPTPLDASSYFIAAHDIMNSNQQAGTDSDGFVLGASYGLWREMIIFAKVDKIDPYSDSKTNDYLQDAFDKMRAKQAALNLSDEEVREALGQTDPAAFKSDLDLWGKRKANLQAAKIADQDRNRVAEEKARQGDVKAHLPQLVKESQTRALKKHPDLATAGSALNTKFVAEYRTLQADKSPRLAEPDWPEKLADECASGSAAVANR